MQILRHGRISVTVEIKTETASEVTCAALEALADALGHHGRDHWPKGAPAC